MADGENDPSPMSSTIPARVDLRPSDTHEGRRLEYFTLGWNLTEALVGIGAGVIAGSTPTPGEFTLTSSRCQPPKYLPLNLNSNSVEGSEPTKLNVNFL